MKIIYLLPPSEGKNTGGTVGPEKLSFDFKKPLDIAINATEKDLKCKSKRYEEGIKLNRILCKNTPPVASDIPLDEGEQKESSSSEVRSAIERYTGVMYNAIDYAGMCKGGKKYFSENFLILSGMYGLVKPDDLIGNYKLPIETKGLYKFWGDTITQAVNNLDIDYVVDMLPGSYAKMIDFKNIQSKIVRVNFLHKKGGEIKKISHGVKKIKGEYIKNICENFIEKIDDFPGEKVQISENEYHINIISK